jgi:hypothetical protein
MVMSIENIILSVLIFILEVVEFRIHKKKFKTGGDPSTYRHIKQEHE